MSLDLHHFDREILKLSDYENLRPNLVARLDEYIAYGHEPSSHFLRALLRDSFTGIVAHADETARDNLIGWATLMTSRVPQGCFGSDEKIDSWREAGGLDGMNQLAS